MPEPKIAIIENPALDIDQLSNFLIQNTFSIEIYANFEEYLMKSNARCHFLFLEAGTVISSVSEINADTSMKGNPFHFWNDAYTYTYHRENNSGIILEALKKGADDFFPVPPNPEILLMRLRAQHRRIKRMYKNFSHEQTTLNYKNLTIDSLSKEVYVKGQRVDLTHSEYILIHTLAREPHYIYNMEYLFRLITGQKSLGDYNALMTHISRLRKKIAAIDPEHQYILTVRNKGYKFNITYNPGSEKFDDFL